MDRLPMSVDVIWLQSRPEIRFKIADSTRGDVVFRGETPDELLGTVVNAYAHALALTERLKSENAELRKGRNR